MPLKIPYPQILNEQSFTECPSRELFSERMRGLKRVMDDMHELGFSYAVAKSRGIYDRRCVGGRTLREWLLDKNATDPEERTLRTFFRTVLTKTPAFEDVPDEFTGTCDFDLFFGGRQIWPGPNAEIPAFLVSLQNTLPSVALNTGAFSGKRNLAVEIQELDERGNLTHCSETLAVATDSAGVESLRGTITERLVRELTTGRAILEAQRDLWPAISFSVEAREQLERIDVRTDLLVGSLMRLHTAFTRCVLSGTTALQNEYGSRKSIIMTESETVKNMHMKTRTFHWSDGSRVCLPHVRLNLQYRIHFLPDFSTRTLFVGYIGPHLPTGKYR